MPTLYVENVPAELYEALRKRARQRRKSIAAEVIGLLEENIPTERELARRRGFLRRMRTIRSVRSISPGPFPASEEMQREDRRR
jgi:plasmid stability protein